MHQQTQSTSAKPQAISSISQLGVSIKKSQPITISSEKGQEEHAQHIENKPVTQENVEGSWRKFAEQLPHEQVAIKNRMQSMRITLIEGTQVEICVENELNAKQLNEMMVDIRRFMQKDLQNFLLEPHVVIKELPLSVKSLSRFEQYKKMVEKNPWLTQLRDNLGLELS